MIDTVYTENGNTEISANEQSESDLSAKVDNALSALLCGSG